MSTEEILCELHTVGKVMSGAGVFNLHYGYSFGTNCLTIQASRGTGSNLEVIYQSMVFEDNALSHIAALLAFRAWMAEHYGFTLIMEEQAS